MGFEQETLPFVVVGFLLVMAVCILLLGFIGYKTKNKKFGWFIGQFIFLFLAFYKFYGLLNTTYEVQNAFASENATLLLGQAGVFWAVSMIFMCIGITSLTKHRNREIVSN